MELFAAYGDLAVDPRRWAAEREAEGWHGLTCPDHLFLGTGRPAPFPHLWVTLAAMAGVANNLLRSPVEFAQGALALQQVSDGRAEAALGAGWSAGEVAALGLDFPPAPVRARRFREAVLVARELLATGSCRFEGRYYRIEVPALGPRALAPPPLTASVGGPWTIREISPLVERVELKIGRSTRSGALAVPVRRKLAEASLSFDRCYTHTSPCSPSRATLFTGEYVTVHGVHENVASADLYLKPEEVTTLGHRLQANGYRTPYFGKWHLYPGPTPPMDAYGFTDWVGNDLAFWGLAGSGTEFDDGIAEQAASWLRDHGGGAGPWFLTCALVNPHDIMWYPADQPWYPDRHPRHFAEMRDRYAAYDWGRAENLPLFGAEYARYAAALPENFDTDLSTRPEVHRRFNEAHARRAGWLDEHDVDAWLRQLDYYTVLHEMNDQSLGKVLHALAVTGQAEDTVVIVTSDHGDQCGSHGLRSKGPWNYEETLRIPLTMSVPGITVGGTRTDGLCSTVDLAVTILELAGIEPPDHLPGTSLVPLMTGQSEQIRETVLFAQDWAWYEECLDSRYASRGFSDGRYKYARYYGVGGSGLVEGGRFGEKRIGPDAPFDEQEHELYDLQEDPYERVNLANDPGRRSQVRRMYDRLLELERAELVRRGTGPARPPERGARGA